MTGVEKIDYLIGMVGAERIIEELEFWLQDDDCSRFADHFAQEYEIDFEEE